MADRVQGEVRPGLPPSLCASRKSRYGQPHTGFEHGEKKTVPSGRNTAGPTSYDGTLVAAHAAAESQSCTFGAARARPRASRGIVDFRSLARGVIRY